MIHRRDKRRSRSCWQRSRRSRSGCETQPESKADPAVQANLQTAQQIKAQDVEVTKTGTATLRKGVAKERRISIEDAQMQHGRKSRSVRVDGYKRHVVHDLDSGLVRAVGITPANAPEASVTEAIKTDLAAQQALLAELHIDRAYLSQHTGARAVCGSGDLLQSLAGAQWPALSQDRL